MPTLVALTGFEFGSTAGWATGNAGNKIFDVITGSPSIVTTTPEDGTYCLEVSATGAAEGIAWGTGTLGASKTHLVTSVVVRFPSALPSADLDLIQLQCPGPNYVLRFRNSDDKLCVGLPGGSEVAGPVVVADTSYRIDIHMDVSANPNTIDWQVDGAAQTQFSNAVAADTVFSCDLGWTLSAQTGTVRYDNWAVSTTAADYPLGDFKVIAVKPDTGGSLDVSTITTSEWNTFAGSTPTLTAWNATTALAAVAELPVDLGAAQDGFCRISGTDADYVGIPFTTYTLTGGETVLGLRMLACCWAATTTAAFHSFASYNGTTATTLFAAADANADNTSTPAWVCKMLTTADFDTQAELDALQIRVGSTDTNPDAGVHAVYVEIAVSTGGGATVNATAIAATAALPAAAASASSTVSPAAVAAVAALPAAAAGGGAGVNAAAITVTTAMPAGEVQTGSTVSPAAVAAVAALPAPTVQAGGNATVNAAVIALTTALPGATLAAGSTVAPAVVAAAASLPAAAVQTGSTVSPATVTAVAALPAPSVQAGGGATINAAVIALTTALPAAAAAASSTATPGAITAVTALPAAAASASSTVSPAAIAAVTALPAPSLPAGVRAYARVGGVLLVATLRGAVRIGGVSVPFG